MSVPETDIPFKINEEQKTENNGTLNGKNYKKDGQISNEDARKLISQFQDKYGSSPQGNITAGQFLRPMNIPKAKDSPP